MSDRLALSLESQLSDAIEQRMADGEIRGLQVFVALRGETAVDRAFGLRVQDAGPLEPATRIGVFSASKAVTGVAVHIAVERGQLRYSDSLSRHVEEFQAHGKDAITLHQALVHQAGIPDFFMQHVPPEAFSDWDAAIRQICEMPLEYEPGTRTAYHPLTVWGIMGEAIRRRDGRAFAEYCRQEIFEPLGMTRSTWGLRAELWDEATDLEGIGEAENLCLRSNQAGIRGAVIPGGGLFTTARDLGRLYLALGAGGTLDGRRIVTAETVALATRRHADDAVPGAQAGLGYGFTVGVNPDRVDGRGNLGSQRQFGHSGFCVAQAWCDPATSAVAVFLANRGLGQAAGDRLFNELCDIVHRAAG